MGDFSWYSGLTLSILVDTLASVILQSIRWLCSVDRVTLISQDEPTLVSWGRRAYNPTCQPLEMSQALAVVVVCFTLSRRTLLSWIFLLKLR